MMMKRQTTIKISIILAAIVIAVAAITPIMSLVLAQTGSNSNSVKTLRIGYFPNINHAQAVIGFGKGNFQKALGNNIQVQTTVFNAGPSAIEALLAKRIDATYVGPNPAINGYVVSGGKDLNIIAGASSGGASFVVRNDAGINSPKDLAGKRLASPELGNTQDIALRSYLLKNGLKTTDQGGSVVLTPVANPDILTLFLKKQLDGAWVPEPWATRLVNEANGRIFLDERNIWPGGKFVTANIAVSTDYLKNNQDVISKLLAAHVNETAWINSHKDEAVQVFNTQVKKLTGKSIPRDELKQAFSRIDFTYDPIKLSLFQSANNAYDLGFLAKGKPHPDLSGIFNLTILDQVLRSKGLTPIEGVLSQQSPQSSSAGG
ncbi:MAG TPA: ABC transporter substrate-binding protein, partial [Nitrososphaeraceae archaeon]|nr:ABC transporter substrate-binding protein [Nitrososphaeraceae archaeon]